MRQKSHSTDLSSEEIVKGIRRATRKRYSAEDKIRIVHRGCGSKHDPVSRAYLRALRGHRLDTDRTSDRTSDGRMPSISRVRRAGRCDCSTRRMISSFSEPGSLMPRLPHPRSCFF
jgi:hypothetical protein